MHYLGIFISELKKRLFPSFSFSLSELYPIMNLLLKQLITQCTCTQTLAGNCHLRSSGIIITNQSGDILSADPEAIHSLRGPATQWDDDQLVTIRDNSIQGTIESYWQMLDLVEADESFYLVVRRNEDDRVCWIHICVHSLTRGQTIWHVVDKTGQARCLGLSQLQGTADYSLELEDDGFPYIRMQDPLDRTVVVEWLRQATNTELFTVVELTGFGAIDSMFPKRFLGWSVEDLMDRSFIGLLCEQDRTFFCRVLRRCMRDSIPQRLLLKVENQDTELADCDVTVLMPDSMQQPVLVIRANDLVQTPHRRQKLPSLVKVTRLDACESPVEPVDSMVDDLLVPKRKQSLSAI